MHSQAPSSVSSTALAELRAPSLLSVRKMVESISGVYLMERHCMLSTIADSESLLLASRQMALRLFPPPGTIPVASRVSHDGVGLGSLRCYEEIK